MKGVIQMRLIDANELEARLRMQPNNLSKISVIDMVHASPTIEERKTGIWKEDGTCSVCGTYSSLNLSKVKYCPECGAEMKGGAE